MVVLVGKICDPPIISLCLPCSYNICWNRMIHIEQMSDLKQFVSNYYWVCIFKINENTKYNFLWMSGV